MSEGVNDVCGKPNYGLVILKLCYYHVSLRTVKENAEALLVATDEIGLEVNDKTKYMVMSRDLNAGRGHSVKIGNSSIE
jgi:hypothetical protein